MFLAECEIQSLNICQFSLFSFYNISHLKSNPHTFRASPTPFLPKIKLLFYKFKTKLVMFSGPRPSNNKELSVDTGVLQIPFLPHESRKPCYTFTMTADTFFKNKYQLKTSG